MNIALNPTLKIRGRKPNPNKLPKIAGKRGRPSLAPELRKQKPAKIKKRIKSERHLLDMIENDPSFDSRFEQFKIQSKNS
jgi:hypothetical protein